ncbi:MAG: 5-(carboxyamino)imidazole ribonucleotide synthase [Verrucomicrobia bacterium]|nr:5-(carboxyamino)imidazole ribonucleotide synthase [Verrucomicrobiota bacterium]
MSKIEGSNDNRASAASEGKFPPVFLPGATIGILGGGQLGQMSAMAAKSLGYKVAVYDESPGGPACSSADLVFTAPFDDLAELARFAAAVDLATVEFENIPVGALEFLEVKVPVRPSATVVRTCQDRVLEKEFLSGNGFPVVPFRVITSAAELASGLSALNAPSILKTAALGYDGKGQISLTPGDDAEDAWVRLGAPRAVLEQRIAFASEVSVICARTPRGETRCFPVQTNVHHGGILDVTSVPAEVEPAVADKAQAITSAIAGKLGVVGLITAEFFVLPASENGGGLIVNELAPRPHNSGHHSMETTVTSQFAQHIRAVCGLPLGPVELRSPGVMINLLGDLWQGGEPDWELLLREPRLFLHLYGKCDPKAGRKMGHFTLLGEAPDSIRRRALELRGQMIRP